MTSESTYYNDGGVLVTSARLEVPGQMFAMAQITSVRAERQSSWGVGILAMVVGVLILGVSLQASESSGGAVCGGISLAVGLIIGLVGNSASLYVATAGGEVKALRSGNRKFIEDVATAIKTAIIRRG